MCASTMPSAAVIAAVTASPAKSIGRCERERREKAYGEERLKGLSHGPL
jgi:hypothetical protein